MITTIFFDMDGVLTNWNKKVIDHFPKYKTVEDLKKIEKHILWKMVNSIPYFWETLEPIEGTDKIFEYCYNKYNVEILSAPGLEDKRCIPGKVYWLNKHYGQYKNLPMNFVQAKYKRYFAKPGHLLCDDHSRNVNQFIEDGGEAILFENAQQCMEELIKRGL